MPSPLSTKVTPDGSAPLSLSAAVGNACEVTVNVPLWLTGKLVVLPLVIVGAWSTVSVKLWVPLPTEFWAVIWRG